MMPYLYPWRSLQSACYWKNITITIQLIFVARILSFACYTWLPKAITNKIERAQHVVCYVSLIRTKGKIYFESILPISYIHYICFIGRAKPMKVYKKNLCNLLMFYWAYCKHCSRFACVLSVKTSVTGYWTLHRIL